MLRKKNNSKSKTIIGLVILVAILLTGVVTCPDKQAHQDAVMNEVNSAINTSMKEELKPGNSSIEKGLFALGTAIASNISEPLIKSNLKVNNYFIFSTGQISTDEGYKTISAGIFGHIFTFLDAEDIKQALTNK